MATSTIHNKRVLFTKVPVGFPVPNQDMMMETQSISVSSLPANSVLLKNLFLSLDPYMRGRMRQPSTKSYTPPFTLGEVMTGGGVAEVYFSSHSQFKQGDLLVSLSGAIGWEEFTLLTSPDLQDWIKLPAEAKISLTTRTAIPLSYYAGVLGMPGLTAWVGVNKIIKPVAKEGQTILISAAAGAVGQLVGQLAKFIGLKVVGSVGSDDKVEYLLRELKFDAAFNYKKVPDLGVALSQHCPQGIDFYWENVGGETLEKVLDCCNNFATIVACGMISQYNTTTPYGVKNLMQIVAKRLTIRGFMVFDHASEQQNFHKELSDLIRRGKIIYKEDISVGIESAQEAFVGMLKGKNFGKTVVQIVADQSPQTDLPKTQ